jgi:hypothetical protein
MESSATLNATGEPNSPADEAQRLGNADVGGNWPGNGLVLRKPLPLQNPGDCTKVNSEYFVSSHEVLTKREALMERATPYKRSTWNAGDNRADGSSRLWRALRGS